MTHSIGFVTKIYPKMVHQDHWDGHGRSTLDEIDDDFDRLIKNKKIGSFEIKSQLSDITKKMNQLSLPSGGELAGAARDRLGKMEHQISSLAAIHGNVGSGSLDQLPDSIRSSRLSNRYCVQSNALYRESARQLVLASLDLLTIIAEFMVSTYYTALQGMTRLRIERLDKEMKSSIAHSNPLSASEKAFKAHGNSLSQKQRLRDFTDKLEKIADRLMHFEDMKALRVQGQKVLCSKVVNLASLKHLKNLEKKLQVARYEPFTKAKNADSVCQKWLKRVDRQTLIQSDGIKKHDERVKKYYKLIARFETTKRVSRRVYDTMMALREDNGSFQRR